MKLRFCIVSIVMFAAQTNAETVTVAAASDLVFCIEELNTEFRKANPSAEIKVSNGSSGNFFAQIENGAPFDLFLSADMNYPRQLVKAGLAEEFSLTLYGEGRIVLWSTSLDVSRGLELVRDIRKLAIANPEHAPYGRAAKAALEHAQLWDAVKSKLVIGENIAQTAQFVQTGNADAGIVALSLVVAPKLEKVGRYFEIPRETYPTLEQGAVLTKHGAVNPTARRYLEFLRSKEGRAIFDRYGFRLPQI